VVVVSGPCSWGFPRWLWCWVHVVGVSHGGYGVGYMWLGFPTVVMVSGTCGWVSGGGWLGCWVRCFGLQWRAVSIGSIVAELVSALHECTGTAPSFCVLPCLFPSPTPGKAMPKGTPGGWGPAEPRVALPVRVITRRQGTLRVRLRVELQLWASVGPSLVPRLPHLAAQRVYGPDAFGAGPRA